MIAMLEILEHDYRTPGRTVGFIGSAQGNFLGPFASGWYQFVGRPYRPLPSRGGRLTVAPQWNSSSLRISVPVRQPEILLKDCGDGRFQLQFMPDIMSGLNDIFLQFDYQGDVGSLYLAGRLIADNYNNGTPWWMGLKRFLPAAMAQGLVARFWPWRKGQMQNISTPMANRMEFAGEEIWRLRSFTVIPEHAVRIG